MNRNEDLAAKELDVFLTSRQTGQKVPTPVGVDAADVSVVDELQVLADSIQLDQSFSHDLEQRLIQTKQIAQPPSPTSSWRHLLESMGAGKLGALTRLRLSHVGALVILLAGLVVALPVVAQTALEYFAPREVTELQPIQADYETPPSAPRWLETEQLEEVAEFTLIEPTYLPPDCVLNERFFASRPRVVYLNYSCVSIAEQKTQVTHRPRVGEDSVQEITVNGKPAVYINGIWVVMPGSEERIWKEGVVKELILEQDGLLIRMQSDKLSKEELIKIAESLE
ncbi:MAG: DUF4367 domain-containing protein [Chloroflexota bacterium]|nr:DUF4367 domain-containing protein [Chloroflexota bacterium]